MIKKIVMVMLFLFSTVPTNAQLSEWQLNGSFVGGVSLALLSIGAFGVYKDTTKILPILSSVLATACVPCAGTLLGRLALQRWTKIPEDQLLSKAANYSAYVVGIIAFLCAYVYAKQGSKEPRRPLGAQPSEDYGKRAQEGLDNLMHRSPLGFAVFAGMAFGGVYRGLAGIGQLAAWLANYIKRTAGQEG